MRRRGQIAQPQAIDDLTGFKVNYRDLRKQWDGKWSLDPDIRNPQDFLRSRPDNPKLDHPRPEASDTFMADCMTAEDGTPIACENGTPLLTEGPLNGSGL